MPCQGGQNAFGNQECGLEELVEEKKNYDGRSTQFAGTKRDRASQFI